MATAAVKDSREDRVAKYVTDLTGFCEQAEAVKDAPKPVADFVKAVGKLTGYVDSMNGDAAAVVAALVEQEKAILWQTALGDLRDIASSLSGGSVEGPSREDGDALAKKVRGAIDADLIDDDETVKVLSELVTRWDASVPKGRKSGSGSGASRTIADLGFTVTVLCQKQGCDWSSSTTRDNLNSIRDLCHKHGKAKHGQPLVNGNPLHAGLTEALAAVGMASSKFTVGSAAAAEGGGYTVTRKA